MMYYCYEYEDNKIICQSCFGGLQVENIRQRSYCKCKKLVYEIDFNRISYNITNSSLRYTFMYNLSYKSTRTIIFDLNLKNIKEITFDNYCIINVPERELLLKVKVLVIS